MPSPVHESSLHFTVAMPLQAATVVNINRIIVYVLIVLCS